jgi:hypothetical protein
MEEALKNILALPDSAGEDQILEAVRKLKQEQSARNTSTERQARIRSIMASANVSHENALLVVSQQDSEKERQEREEAEQAKRQPVRQIKEPVPAGRR